MRGFNFILVASLMLQAPPTVSSCWIESSTEKLAAPTPIPISQPIGGVFNCKTNNPCTRENLKSNKFFFPHEISGKFVQCDEGGSCFTRDCPEGLVWDEVAYACNYPKMEAFTEPGIQVEVQYPDVNV